MTIFKEVRINKEKTQQQMAEILEIPLRRYQSYERGERVPNHETLAKILYIRNKGQDRMLSEILNNLIKDDCYDKNFKKRVQ